MSLRLLLLSSLSALVVAMALAVTPGAASARQRTPEGSWSGALQLPGAQLRLVFHVVAEGDRYSATMDSPDQGVRGIPAGPLEIAGDSVTIPVAVANGSFAGVLRGDTLEGVWRQSGRSLPLILVRGEAIEEAPDRVRPQHPEAPFPYRTEEVRYPNGAAGIELAGTLTLPEGDAPAPAVVLISGSGPQNRDEEVAGHRIFHVLADHLTRAGVAVLRFDDRGVGESTGTFATATSEDFASDVEAGVAFLRRRADIDPDRVGLIGHSEGGLVAPMVARSDDALAFLVLLAGPGVNGEEVLVSQTARMQRGQGVPEAQIAANERAIRGVAEVLRTQPAEAWKEAMMEVLLDAVPAGVSETQARAAVEPQVTQFASPWMAFFVAHDPIPDLESLTIPVLALNGGLDVQVLPEINLPPIRDALSGNPGAEVIELPGLNHLFQPAETGMPAEYAEIETTFDPAALARIAEWIGEAVGGAGG
jgi:pimeloyl-ACP methyl ester carboxylesterase